MWHHESKWAHNTKSQSFINFLYVKKLKIVTKWLAYFSGRTWRCRTGRNWTFIQQQQRRPQEGTWRRTIDECPVSCHFKSTDCSAVQVFRVGPWFQDDSVLECDGAVGSHGHGVGWTHLVEVLPSGKAPFINDVTKKWPPCHAPVNYAICTCVTKSLTLSPYLRYFIYECLRTEITGVIKITDWCNIEMLKTRLVR